MNKKNFKLDKMKMSSFPKMKQSPCPLLDLEDFLEECRWNLNLQIINQLCLAVVGHPNSLSFLNFPRYTDLY